MTSFGSLVQRGSSVVRGGHIDRLVELLEDAPGNQGWGVARLIDPRAEGPAW